MDKEYKHILIDEYQDLNACDLAVVNELAKRGAELFVAGDDDQSIYGFRFATLTVSEILISFIKTPKSWR